jgi:hypothetical protein
VPNRALQEQKNYSGGRSAAVWSASDIISKLSREAQQVSSGCYRSLDELNVTKIAGGVERSDNSFVPRFAGEPDHVASRLLQEHSLSLHGRESPAVWSAATKNKRPTGP